MDSILTSIKKMIGIDEDYTAFDTDLIILINSCFSVLHQLGAGPKDGFAIVDKTATWEDYDGDDAKLEMIKAYIYYQVKPVFDPPSNSFVIEMYRQKSEELAFRINVAADPGYRAEPEVTENDN